MNTASYLLRAASGTGVGRLFFRVTIGVPGYGCC